MSGLATVVRRLPQTNWTAARAMLRSEARLLARNPALTMEHARRLAKAWLIMGALIALALAAFVVSRVANHAIDRTLDTATEAGATAAVASGQAQTLDQLKDANDAEQDLRSSGERSATRYAQCLRDSRRRQACERYNPDAPIE